MARVHALHVHALHLRALPKFLALLLLSLWIVLAPSVARGATPGPSGQQVSSDLDNLDQMGTTIAHHAPPCGWSPSARTNP